MNINYKTLTKIFFFLFVTMSMFNSIIAIPTISMIGSIGKLLVCLFAIIALVPFFIQIYSKTTFHNSHLFYILMILILLSSILYQFRNPANSHLLYNMTVFIYPIFYFFCIKILSFENQSISKYPNELTKIELFRLFRLSFLLNFLFWTTFFYINGISFIDKLGNYGGFLQFKNDFGAFAVAGFLSCFYLFYNKLSQDKSKFNIALMIMYGYMCFISSRNAFIIMISAILIYYLLAKNIKLFLWSLPVLFLGIWWNSRLFFNSNSFDIVNDLLSGRLLIWTLAINEYSKQNFLLGSGIFNSNDSIQESGKNMDFHYLDQVGFLFLDSSFVSIFVSGGIVALIVFILIIFRTLKKSELIDQSLIGSIAIGAIFESYLVQPFMFLSIIFYILIISNNLVLNSTKNKDLGFKIQ